MKNYNDTFIKPYFDLIYNKRPEFELYNVVKDPFCLNNLAGRSQYIATENELKAALLEELKRTGDPRTVGPDPEIFDSYKTLFIHESISKPQLKTNCEK